MFLLKGICQIGQKKYLLSRKIKILYHGHDLTGEEIIGTFYENELQKTNKKEFRIEKVLKKKGDKLYVKRNGYDNSFNSWIDKKSHCVRHYFDGRSSKQNYLVFLPMGKYFELNSVVGVIDRVLSWQSKGISNESIKSPSTSNLKPRLSYNDTKIKVQVTGSCSKQPRFTFTHKRVVNIYIVYELGASSLDVNDPTIKNFLFGAVTLNKNADI